MNEEIKAKWISGEIFQDNEYANIFGKYRKYSVTRVSGNTCFLMRQPLLGIIKAKVYFSKGDANELLAECYRLSKEKNIPYIEIHTSISDKNFSQFPNKGTGTYVIDLKQDIETIWKNLDRSAKGPIKKAKKYNVEVVIADRENDFLEWWNIYTMTAHRKKFVLESSLIYKELFQNKKLSKLFIAKIDGKIVSGNLMLLSDNGIIWKLGGSDKAYSKFGPNDLIHWEIIEWAKNQGYSYYDMGGALPLRYDENGILINEGHGEGPSAFKKKFGGEYREIYRYQIVTEKMKYGIISALINVRNKLMNHL